MHDEILTIQQQILQLPIKQRADLTQWLNDMQAMDKKKALANNDLAKKDDDWDKQMAQDADNGLLDFLYEEAMQEKKAGTLRELP